MKSQLLTYQDKEFAHISRIINNLSNQWRQPIAYLSSQILYLETLRRFASKEEVEQELSKMIPALNDSIDKMQQTVDTFSKFYSFTSHENMLNPKKEITQLLSLFEQKIILHNIDLSLRCKIDYDLNICVKSFTGILLILFENILLGYESVEQKEGKIAIGFEKEGGGFVLSLSSNASTHINSDERMLGLTVAKTIAKERLSGELQVVSEGEQTTFKIMIRQDT
jgi:hypothetical protein